MRRQERLVYLVTHRMTARTHRKSGQERFRRDRTGERTQRGREFGLTLRQEVQADDAEDEDDRERENNDRVTARVKVEIDTGASGRRRGREGEKNGGALASADRPLQASR